MTRRRWVFHGRVQGVGFRMFCRSAALARNAFGWVRNRPDGAVEMEAEASAEGIAALLRDVRAGHPWARVDKVEEMELPARNDAGEGFEVTY